MAELARTMLPGPMRDSRRAARPAGASAPRSSQLRFRVAADEAGGRGARAKVLAALDRLEAELDASGEYLVGDSFSVADLTAASLLYPLVNPPEGPRSLPGDRRGVGGVLRSRSRATGRPLDRGDVPPPPRAGPAPTQAISTTASTSTGTSNGS